MNDTESDVRRVFLSGYLVRKAGEMRGESVQKLPQYPVDGYELKKIMCEIIPLLEDYDEVKSITSELNYILTHHNTLLSNNQLRDLKYYFTLGLNCSDETYDKCMK